MKLTESRLKEIIKEEIKLIKEKKESRVEMATRYYGLREREPGKVLVNNRQLTDAYAAEEGAKNIITAAIAMLDTDPVDIAKLTLVITEDIGKAYTDYLGARLNDKGNYIDYARGKAIKSKYRLNQWRSIDYNSANIGYLGAQGYDDAYKNSRFVYVVNNELNETLIKKTKLTESLLGGPTILSLAVRSKR